MRHRPSAPQQNLTELGIALPSVACSQDIRPVDKVSGTSHNLISLPLAPSRRKFFNNQQPISVGAWRKRHGRKTEVARPSAH